jgi:hypothetical protein
LIHPEKKWYTIKNELSYRINLKERSVQSLSENRLKSGLDISLTAGQEKHLINALETTHDR